MENNYYDEIAGEIEAALAENNLEEARYLLKREFSMPYIPSDAEAKLKELQGKLRYLEGNADKPTEASMEHLLHQLKGRPASQIAAVNALADRNLRTVIPEIRDWLAKDPVPEAAAMMIELLAEQEIPEEFVITRDGVEYTFAADAVTPLTRSDGFRLALAALSDWLDKEPSLLELARTILVSRCYMALPLSYEAGEAVQLAEECCEEVLRSMGMEERIEAIHEKARNYRGNQKFS